MVVRLRPEGRVERAVLDEGLCGSATFRSLVDSIRRSDLIVYVSMRPLGDRRLSGRLDFLTATSTERILRAVFGFPLDRVTRIAVLGHELQHAVEVGASPGVRTLSAFVEHFRSHGRPSGIESGYETAAARQAEIKIRQDLSRAPSCAPAGEG